MEEALVGAAGTYKTGVIGVDKKGLFEGEQSNPAKEYDADGDMYLTWYVQISDKNLHSQAFNFTLTNQLNSEEDYITHFQLINIDPRLNPLYYMAESYVKSYDASTKVATFEPDPKVLPTRMFCISSAMQKFSATHSVSHYDGYRSCDVIDGMTDFTYHIGTLQEWRSIIPCPGTEGAVTEDILSTSYASGLKTEPLCVFGYNDETKSTGVTGKSYWSSYTTNSNKRYAIRFLDTDHCSVWKYEYKNNMGIISSKLIDKMSSTDTDALAAMMATISSASDSYWEEDENSGTFQRFLYGSGRRDGNSDGPPNSYTTEKYTWILLATMSPTSSGNCLDVCIGPGHNRTAPTVECTIEPSNYSSWGFAITLFRESP